MSSGKRSGYMSWDKGDQVERDVGLGLNMQFHHQQQQQQQRKMMRAGASDQAPSPTLSSRFGGGEDGTRQSFTVDQRQELERQSVIYKYMMASMPVPPQLLIPLSQYHPPSSDFAPLVHSNSSGLELRHMTSSNRGGDTEPWRCRRTDGKKWRCSRDVAPDHKYCERHSHKGRPSRSRKPVESLLLSSATPTPTGPTPTTLAVATNPIGINLSSSTPSSSSFDFPPPLSHYNVNNFPRYPECDWFMKRESVGVHLCQQQQLGGLEVETSSRGGDVGGSQSNDHVSPINEDHQRSCLLPRPFIEAWSLRDRDLNKDTFTGDQVDVGVNNCPASSVLPLTLGIDHYDHTVSDDDSRDHASIIDHHDGDHDSSHHQPLNWMNSTSWIGSPPGGPLAEALCLGMSMSGTGAPNANAMGSDSSEGLSPYTYGRTTSSSTTTVTGSKTYTC